MKIAVLFAAALLSVSMVSGCVSQGDSTAGAGEVSVYNITEVAAHSTADDCWLAIHGKVYDVTGFTPSHPGGEAILQGCGKDATQLYETRPMGSGTPHSDRARSLLQNYYIGEIAGGG